MKFLLSLTLALICLSVSAQKGKPYISILGGISPKNGFNKGIGQLSFGGFANGVGFGVGAGYIDYGKPYIPVTVDFSFFGQERKVLPVGLIKAGYGFFNQAVYGGKVTGGFTGSAFLGISAPLKDYTRVFLAGGFTHYGFKSTSRYANGVTSSDERFSIVLGFKF